METVAILGLKNWCLRRNLFIIKVVKSFQGAQTFKDHIHQMVRAKCDKSVSSVAGTLPRVEKMWVTRGAPRCTPGDGKWVTPRMFCDSLWFSYVSPGVCILNFGSNWISPEKNMYARRWSRLHFVVFRSKCWEVLCINPTQKEESNWISWNVNWILNCGGESPPQSILFI